MVQKYRPLFYDVEDANEDGDKYKIIPTCILNASRSIKMAFFEGYYEADGSKTNNYDCDKNPSFAIKGKISAQCLYYLTKSIGFNMYLQISDHKKKQEMYWMNQIRDTSRSETIIKKIVEQETVTSQFVYDLETEEGLFGAGVGKLQLANTDSVFLKFKYNRDEVFKRPPIEMEFEKVFQPFILLTKKRYIANKYEDTKDPFKLKGVDAKGIALTRRDYCKMVKNCYKNIIDTIMKSQTEEGLKKSISVFKDYISKIDKYDIDLDDLVVSAMLAKTYKTKPVHVLLAEKLKQRKEEVQVGDRIPYIYIESDDPKKQKSELGEDPVYATKNGLKFNRTCYLEQLAKPILGFYDIVLKDHKSLFVEVLNYVNVHLEKYGGKKLKESEFKNIE
jgi:DNA polymerase elongation subunit (family B)